MNFRLPRSMFWRLGLVLVTVQVGLTLAAGWFVYEHVRSFHVETVTHHLARVDHLVEATYCGFLRDGDFAGLQHALRADADAAGLRITVVLADGTPIAESHDDPANMDNHASRREIAAAFAEGVGQEVRTSPTEGIRMVYHARRVEFAPGEFAVIRAAMPFEAVQREYRSLGGALAAAGGASLAVTVLVIVLVSRHFAGQVSRLARGATRFAAGQLDHRIADPRSTELRSLADALNRMAEQLNQRMQMFQSQQNEVQAILQSMSDGVIALDLDQRVFNINEAAARLLSLNGRPAKGRLLHEVIRQPDVHRFVALAVEGHIPDQVEFDLGGETGVRVRLTGEELRDAGGSVNGLLLLLEDVTQIRRLESMRTDFASNVSHELRTPITNIKGYVETLLEVGFDDAAQTRRFLTIVKQNSDRLASIVEDVLSLTRLEQPKAEDSLERHPAATRTLLAAVAAQFADTARQKSITLSIDSPENLRADVQATLMEQAVGNLVSNAINYSPPGTSVVLRARQRDDGDVELAVIDQGPGIAGQHLDRIFERFYRVDKGRSRELGGTGLGLAIVKHIARAHGGRIEVDSAVGRGSTFTLIIPATQ